MIHSPYVRFWITQTGGDTRSKNRRKHDIRTINYPIFTLDHMNFR
ncbi:hypothetical protein [Methylocystis sp. ATCC 49242]|nr:hypothetical protein [Methylocystis sp. ATCC 49242]